MLSADFADTSFSTKISAMFDTQPKVGISINFESKKHVQLSVK